MRSKRTHAALTIPEVVDQVLVHSTKRCLKKCSLVCREWAYLTAKHLFATIRFNPQHQLPVPLVGEDLSFRPTTAWLVGKPRVVESVRQVIVDQQCTRNNTPSVVVYGDVEYSPQLLEDIYKTFPRLASLTLAPFSEFSPFGSLVESLVPSIPLRIHKLEIVISENTFKLVPIECLVGVFAEIGTLVLARESSKIAQSPEPFRFNRTRIHRLVLRGFDDNLMARICKMVASLDLSSLTSLSVLDHYPVEGVRFVNDLIREHVPHIRDFLVSIEEDIVSDYFPRYTKKELEGDQMLRPIARRSYVEKDSSHVREAFGFVLSSCAKLSNVAIALCIVCNDWLHRGDRMTAWQNENIWHPAIGIALKAAPGTLDHICLCFSYATAYNSEGIEKQSRALHGLNWALLERVLDRHPRLAALEIRLSETLPCPQKAQQIIDSQLPSTVRPKVQYRFTDKFGSDVFG